MVIHLKWSKEVLAQARLINFNVGISKGSKSFLKKVTKHCLRKSWRMGCKPIALKNVTVAQVGLLLTAWKSWVSSTWWRRFTSCNQVTLQLLWHHYDINRNNCGNLFFGSESQMFREIIFTFVVSGVKTDYWKYSEYLNILFLKTTQYVTETNKLTRNQFAK